jgi:hypothetical protein
MSAAGPDELRGEHTEPSRPNHQSRAARMGLSFVLCRRLRDLKKMFRVGIQNDFATLSATSGLSHWKMSEQSCSEWDLPLA